MSDVDHNRPGMTRPDTGDTGIGGVAGDATGIFAVLGPSPGAFAAPGRPEGNAVPGSGLVDPLYAWASGPGGPADTNGASETSVLINPGNPSPQRMGPERWVIAGGTVVALAAAFVAFTAGGTPSHAMPSPFSSAPAQSAPAQSGPGQSLPAQGAQPRGTSATPATCPPVTPAP
jgi:hypothetical protein